MTNVFSTPTPRVTVAATPHDLPQPGLYAWHFLPAHGHLAHYHNESGRGHKVAAGMTYRIDGTPRCCASGLHASIRPLDALVYAPSTIIERVWCSGVIDTNVDKIAAQARACLWLADADAVLQEFALQCAEDALLVERASGREPQPAAWAALDAKRTWLKGEITDQEIDAARSAAWSAARSAAASAQNDRLTAMLMALAPAGYAEVAP